MGVKHDAEHKKHEASRKDLHHHNDYSSHAERHSHFERPHDSGHSIGKYKSASHVTENDKVSQRHKDGHRHSCDNCDYNTMALHHNHGHRSEISHDISEPHIGDHCRHCDSDVCYDSGGNTKHVRQLSKKHDRPEGVVNRNRSYFANNAVKKNHNSKNDTVVFGPYFYFFSALIFVFVIVCLMVVGLHFVAAISGLFSIIFLCGVFFKDRFDVKHVNDKNHDDQCNVSLEKTHNDKNNYYERSEDVGSAKITEPIVDSFVDSKHYTR